jgi:transcriptional regulator with XRE-family HTH domain
VTRTGRPPLADHHGTIAGYRTHGCKCDRCLAAHRRAVTDWRIRSRADQRRDGKDRPTIRQSIPAPPIAAHIAELRASGWTLAAIAAESGVSAAAVSRIARGDRERVWRRIGEALLAVAPLPDLGDYADPVVVDRLIAGGDWKALNATRAERITAAERLWWHWRPIRERQHADGTAPQWLDGPSLTDIERRFSLRAGRDFRRTPDEQPTRGAA